MSGQNYVKGDIVATPAGQINNYMVDTNAYITEMFRGAFPKAPKLIGLVPFARASAENYAANNIAGAFNTLFGELHITGQQGDNITVGVINDKGEIIQLIYECSASEQHFYYKGIISFITVDNDSGFAAWSFWGWLLTQGTTPVPIITAGQFALIVLLNGADDSGLDATLLQDPGNPVHNIGSPDPANYVRGYYGQDIVYCLLQLPERGTGTFAGDYPSTTFTGVAWNLLSALQSAGVYSIRANFNSLTLADQTIDFAFSLSVAGFNVQIDSSPTGIIIQNPVGWGAIANSVDGNSSYYDSFDVIRVDVFFPTLGGATFADDYVFVSWTGDGAPVIVGAILDVGGAWEVHFQLDMTGSNCDLDYDTVVP